MSAINEAIKRVEELKDNRQHPRYNYGLECALFILKEEAEKEKENKVPDEELVRVLFTGWRKGKWIGGTAQFFHRKVYENFIEKCYDDEKLAIFKFMFYIDHSTGKYPNAQGAEIDEYKIVDVNKGGPFIGFRMD